MKALSIRQPWASLIAHGVKDIENRIWKTNYRGRIYIHASAKWDRRSKSRNAKDLLTTEQYNSIPMKLHASFLDRGIVVIDNEIPVSAIIGEVDIVDCVINHDSIWAEKTPFSQSGNQRFYSEELIYNWVLKNPILYDEPILNVKGKLSFWEFDKSLIL